MRFKYFIYMLCVNIIFLTFYLIISHSQWLFLYNFMRDAFVYREIDYSWSPLQWTLNVKMQPTGEVGASASNTPFFIFLVSVAINLIVILVLEKRSE